MFLPIIVLLLRCSATQPGTDIPPIIVAAGRGDAAEVAALLAAGADPNTLSPDSETPLHAGRVLNNNTQIYT